MLTAAGPLAALPFVVYAPHSVALAPLESKMLAMRLGTLLRERKSEKRKLYA